MQYSILVRKLVVAVCAAGLLAAIYAVPGQASSITVANPTFDATIDSNFSDNGNNYNAGDPLPAGYYVSAPGSSGIRVQATTGLTSGTATFSGWNVVGDIGLQGVQTPDVETSGSFNPGNVGFFTADAVGGQTGTGGFSQDVPGNISFQPSTQYVLTVELLDKGITVTPTIIVDLTAGGRGLCKRRHHPADIGHRAAGQPVVTFTTGLSVPSGLLGILLEGSDTSGELRKSCSTTSR